MLILGIETSCDETAAAIVSAEKKILSNVIFSQIEEHKQYNGVVPELAARMHVRRIKHTIEIAVSEAKIKLSELDAVAVTAGPGLAGCLIVGIMAAKGIASAAQKPIIAVNHLEGHALTARLTNKVHFPYLLLLASGGHCQILAVRGVGQYSIIGQTIDDSAGEAFDKVAKMLGLSYPGGPIIEKLAALGNPSSVPLPCPLPRSQNFSFSGLKTAVRRAVSDTKELNSENIHNICASFQHTVKNIFITKLRKALPVFKEMHPNAQHLVFAGGVAANAYIRKQIAKLAEEYDMKFVAPPVALCTDNAAMIAWAGAERAKLGLSDSLNFAPKARWSLLETLPNT